VGECLETRFSHFNLESETWRSETGFLHKSRLGSKSHCRNPVSRVRNRVSPQISVGKQKSLQKPGFSVLWWVSETGFLN